MVYRLGINLSIEDQLVDIAEFKNFLYRETLGNHGLLHFNNLIIRNRLQEIDESFLYKIRSLTPV